MAEKKPENSGEKSTAEMLKEPWEVRGILLSTKTALARQQPPRPKVDPKKQRIARVGLAIELLGVIPVLAFVIPHPVGTMMLLVVYLFAILFACAGHEQQPSPKGLVHEIPDSDLCTLYILAERGDSKSIMTWIEKYLTKR